MNENEIFGTFSCWKAAEDTWFITGLNGSLYMYLLIGTEKALLVDTAYGYGDLRGLVEKLTDKPVLVINTHGHLDHSGGNGQWQKVYMHEAAPLDFPPTSAENNAAALPYPDYKKIFVHDGDFIELGDRSVEILEIGAHAASSLAILDRKTRMLFVGDELEARQVLLFGNYGERTDLPSKLRRHLVNMKKLKTRTADYDYICPAHNGAPIAKAYLDDYIGLSESILAGRQKTAPLNHFYIEQLPFASRLIRAVFNHASFIYAQDDLEGLAGGD